MLIAALALAAAYGTFLLYTSLVFGWTGLGGAPRDKSGRNLREPLMTRIGLSSWSARDALLVTTAMALIGVLVGFVIFGGVMAPMICGISAATLPVGLERIRVEKTRDEAQQMWPRMIDEIRIRTTTAGLPIPQALIDVGLRGPEPYRPAFAAARRTWLLTTDFAQTITVLKRELADPTGDVVCETLLVAHEVGGTEVERYLVSLAEDRLMDLHGRKDARAKQAGARFARRFVVGVPIGMAVVGLSIGNGRAAYQTDTGQLFVAFGLLVMMGCWIWAGRIMRLPDEERVFPK
jgi:tight adherence protein B